MDLTEVTPAQRKEYLDLPLDEKVVLAKEVINQALDKFDWQDTAVAWTGGKDSTVLLWLIREVVNERGHQLPRAMFVDEGDVFDEIWEFVRQLANDWQLDFSVTHNRDVSSKARKLGDLIKVSDLNDVNQHAIEKLGYEQESFPYEPESYVGNHLMKTVATNMWLEQNGARALFVGVRWDEQPARAEDDFLREIDEPEHFRVEPILAFKEKDIWDAIHQFKIPYVKLYEQGYRSLGARVTTEKSDDRPAWEQDLEHTTERSGRRQDKEQIMDRLRKLGYM